MKVPIAQDTITAEGGVTSYEKCIWRHSPLRFLGYANEVGEAFRPIFPRFVPISYMIAFGYVGCDTVDKSFKVYQKSGTPQAVTLTAVDTLLWQTLASVFIPGQVVKLITMSVTKAMDTPLAVQRLPPVARKYGATIIGLSAVPFIIKPIDDFVDYVFDEHLRRIIWSLGD